MERRLAFVLSGGGARGALQVGALRALFEAGYRPDLVTGASIGAANGAFLAVHGYNLAGLEKLRRVWESLADQDIMPTNLWWQTMRAFFRRSGGISELRVREFAISLGLTESLRFKDLQGPRLYLVAADLNSASQVIFGEDPEEPVLDGLLASMALPPWMMPVRKGGRYLVDGGAVSNLPVEAALRQGATDIIALDLFDPADIDPTARGIGSILMRLDKTVEYRQTRLEIELAEARGVPVRQIALAALNPVPLWDFRHSLELIEQGYRLACQALKSWQPPPRQAGWRQRVLDWIRRE